MKKVKIYNNIKEKECGKSVQNMHWVKKDLFGCFKKEKNVTKTMKQV